MSTNRTFQEFITTIPQEKISIIASGNSINDMSPETFDQIKAKSFMISLNYAPVKIKASLNFWSDRIVTEFLATHFQQEPISMLLCTKENCFPREQEFQWFKDKIDMWFDKNKEALQGAYTIVWLLQLLNRAVSHKEVYIYGLDMTVEGRGPDEFKWYDRFTQFDFNRRGKGSFQAMQKLKECAENFDNYIKKDRIYNCNPKSGYRGFEFKNLLDS